MDRCFYDISYLGHAKPDAMASKRVKVQSYRSARNKRHDTRPNRTKPYLEVAPGKKKLVPKKAKGMGNI
jgi:hypothetical protein